MATLLAVAPALGGLTISPTNGIVMTGADGIVMTGADGIVMTGADGLLNQQTNGIVMTGADGAPLTTLDGLLRVGADGFPYPNSVSAVSADGVNLGNVDGIVMTGADGIVMTGADGVVQTVDSVTITQANGIVMTGADGIVMTGADGIVMTGADGVVMTGADGIVMTGADGIVMTGADGIVMTDADAVQAIGANGVVFAVLPQGLQFAGVTGIVMTGADGILMSGLTGIVMTGADGLLQGALNLPQTGLLSIDPELAVTLNQLTDDSNVNAVVVYHSLPTEADLAALHNIGIIGGTRFHTLPAVVITGTRHQIMEISRLTGVRSIYGNRTLSLLSEPEVRAATGVDRAWNDAEISSQVQNLPVAGRNVTVAVLDTGVDGTHGDLAGRVVRNVKLVDLQSLSLGFTYPVNIEGLPNTDLVAGHGTFVAGLIGGNGTRSNGKFKGVAPAANIVGLSAGELSLLFVLNGLDYILTHREQLGIRVVNCSFSANTVFDANDPVNVATKMLVDAGVNVVFSAGNTGPGAHTMNPYAVAPWVVSVGATDTEGKLAPFSSRGDFANGLFKPTLVAPGVNVVSLRGLGILNVTGVLGLLGADLQKLNLLELPFYTTSNGTSFSAPQVAGAIALMLEANPALTPAQVREILQRTATPLAPYYPHETGAGMLNVHAAVLQAAFLSRKIGTWRGIADRGQVKFVADAPVTFSGTVPAGSSSNTTLQIPANTLIATMQVGWGPMLSTKDLALKAYNSQNVLQAQSNMLNVLGLTGNRESVSLNAPSAGAWRLNVRNTLGGLGTSQPFSGVLEIDRAEYAPITDIGGLSATARNEIYQAIRTFAMWPSGTKFYPTRAVQRADLAAAMVVGGRVPQYLPGNPTYPDVTDKYRRLFVESAQASPTGALFTDIPANGPFRPNDVVTRLVATVALVRAAGLRAEAESKAGILLPFLDCHSIPSSLRGYVWMANSTGLIQTSGLMFTPQGTFTRADLAHALAVIQARATD